MSMYIYYRVNFVHTDFRDEHPILRAGSAWPLRATRRIYIEDLDYNLVKIFDSDYKPTSNQFLGAIRSGS